MQHPELTMLIHDSMQREKKRAALMARPREQTGPITTLRVLMGNTLISLGTRIAPAPRPRLTSSLVLHASIAVSSGK